LCTVVTLGLGLALGPASFTVAPLYSSVTLLPVIWIISPLSNQNVRHEEQPSIVTCFLSLPFEASPPTSLINLPNLISNLNIHYPEILLSVKEMEFIEQRRWNLIFSNELIVKLPEANIGKSLENLKKLIERDKILKSNIIEVDLRINDRAIIKIDGDKLKVNIEEV